VIPLATKPYQPPVEERRPNRHARRHPDQAGERQLARRWASIQATAEYLGVTDRTIRQMIADSRLIGYRSGARLIRLDLNEVDAAMQPFGGGAA
jgi:excisionase family DNA binding protein